MPLKITWIWHAFPQLWIMNAKLVSWLVSHFSRLRASFKLMIYIYIFVLCRWMDTICSVSLYVAITYFITTFVIKYYDCEIGIELVGGWLGVELMRVFEVFCDRCCVRREPGLWLQSCGLWGHAWLILLSWIMKGFNVLHVNPFPSMSLSFVLCVRVKFQKRRFYVVENKSSRDY